MDFFKHRSSHLNPPGTYFDIIRHPNGKEKAIEIAIMQEHRFAFYFWNKWYQNILKSKYEIKKPPSLVSIDWHLDLASPSDLEKEELNKIDLKESKKISWFCWYILHPHNDGHVLSGAYLNMINNIYILCKQPELDKIITFKDKYKKTHKVGVFRKIEDLTKELRKNNEDSLYLDIDLDYFIKSKDFCGDAGTIVPDIEIDQIINPESELMEYVFKYLQGFTIACEPKFCNGIKNSNHILNKLNNNFFDNTLLTKNARWKHL